MTHLRFYLIGCDGQDYDGPFRTRLEAESAAEEYLRQYGQPARVELREVTVPSDALQDGGLW